MKIAIALCLLSCLATGVMAAPAGAPDDVVVGKSIERLTGKLPGGFFYKDSSLRDELNVGQGVPSDRSPWLLPDGNYIFFGCRPHSCMEKSAVLTSPSGEMLGAGLAHFRSCWRDESKVKTKCDGVPMVTLFVRLSHKDDKITHHLKQWSRYVVKAPSYEIRMLPN